MVDQAEGLIAKALRSDEWMERHFGIAAHSRDVAETAIKALIDAGWVLVPPSSPEEEPTTDA